MFTFRKEKHCVYLMEQLTKMSKHQVKVKGNILKGAIQTSREKRQCVAYSEIHIVQQLDAVQNVGKEYSFLSINFPTSSFTPRHHLRQSTTGCFNVVPLFLSVNTQFTLKEQFHAHSIFQLLDLTLILCLLPSVTAQVFHTK